MSWVDLLANIPTNAVLRHRIEELTAEFQAMEQRIAELEAENAELKARLPSTSELNEIEVKILELLGDIGDYVHQDQFAPQLQLSPAKAEHYLRALEDNGYLHASINTIYGISYKLSQKGSGF